MPSKPANLRTRRNGKQWFVVSAWIGEPELPISAVADPLPIFATDPAMAGRTAIAALEAHDVPWKRVRAWAYTDHSLNWEEWR
jgi:hypothetical protein